MIKFNIKKGDRIYLNYEEFFIFKIKNNNNCYSYILKSKDKNILYAEIFLYSKNKIIFNLHRIVDFKIKSGGIFLIDRIYQLTNEKEETYFNEKKEIEKVKIFELHDTKEKIITKSKPKKIIIRNNGVGIFYDEQKLKLEEIKTVKPNEIERPEETKKLKIKFKEPLN